MVNFDVVNDIATTNKTIFLLTDLDVPIDEKGVITNDKKIRLAMPTISYLIKTGARVVIATHLGRPAKRFDARFSTRPIAKYLNDRLPCDVSFCDESIGEKTRRAIFRTAYGDAIVLENLLFHREESEFDMNFAKQLAEGMNIYVNDAFGYCDKSFASVLGVPLFVRATAGLVLTNEIRKLDLFLNSGKGFNTAIVGGDYFDDKFDLLDKLVEVAKFVVIGGNVANTFLVATGKKIGKSFYEPLLLDKAKDLLVKASKNDCMIVLPQDVIVAKDVNASGKLQKKSVNDIKEDDIIIDIADATLKRISDVLDLSKYVFWDNLLTSGNKKSSFSTKIIGEKVALLTKKKKMFSIVSGNDVIIALNKLDKLDKISFVARHRNSTIQYLCGQVLPGIEILRRLSKQLA